MFTEKIKTIRQNLIGMGFSETFFRALAVLEQKEPVKLSALSKEGIQETIGHLHMRGFAKPVSVLNAVPEIVWRPFSEVDSRIRLLNMHGFQNPVVLLESTPQLLRTPLEKITKKIIIVREGGIKNPIELLTRAPAVFNLNLSSEEIQKKIRFARHLRRVLTGVAGVKIGDDAEIVEELPALLHYTISRLLIYARIAVAVRNRERNGGNGQAFFVSLLSVSPAVAVAGWLASDKYSRDGVWRSINLRTRKSSVDNKTLIRHSLYDRIARAYYRYDPTFLKS